MNFLSRWMRSSKEWMESFADKPNAMIALFLLSFADSSFFPLPPDILLVAILAIIPKRSFKAALWCSIGSLLGGVLGYYIGYALMSVVGNKIINFYHLWDLWHKASIMFQTSAGDWFLIGCSCTPMPYKVATISSGAFHYPFYKFMLISATFRSARFFLEATLFYFVGASVKIYIDKYYDKLSIAFLLLIIVGFVIIKYLI